MSPSGTARRRGTIPAADRQIAEGLANLGLTDYEIRVYLAILRHPRSRVPEIARFSGVPQPKVYATIKRLIERGLCESLLGPINQYAALAPQEAFRPLVEEMRAKQSEAKDAIGALKSEFSSSNRSLSRREGRIKMFQGKHAAARNFKFLFAHAEESVRIIARLPLVVSDDESIVADQVKRGVDIQLLIELPDGAVGHEAELAREQKQMGARVVHTPSVPMRMAVFDEKITTLPMVDPSATEGDGFIMLEIRNHSLAAGFAGMFEKLWAEGKSV